MSNFFFMFIFKVFDWYPLIQWNISNFKFFNKLFFFLKKKEKLVLTKWSTSITFEHSVSKYVSLPFFLSSILPIVFSLSISLNVIINIQLTQRRKQLIFQKFPKWMECRQEYWYFQLYTGCERNTLASMLGSRCVSC